MDLRGPVENGGVYLYDAGPVTEHQVLWPVRGFSLGALAQASGTLGTRTEECDDAHPLCVDFKENYAWSWGLTLTCIDPAPGNPSGYVLTVLNKET